MTVTPGDAYRVVVSVDDNIEPFLQVEHRAETLFIGLEPGGYSDINFSAAVTMPQLRGLSLSGGSNDRISGFTTSKPVTIEVSGGGEVRFTGNPTGVNVETSGGARVAAR